MEDLHWLIWGMLALLLVVVLCDIWKGRMLFDLRQLHRMGQAELAAERARVDSMESRLGRLERKIDRLCELMGAVTEPLGDA